MIVDDKQVLEIAGILAIAMGVLLTITFSIGYKIGLKHGMKGESSFHFGW